MQMLSLRAVDARLTPDQMLAGFRPARHFSDATLDGYLPDPRFPSQKRARERVGDFCAGIRVPARRRFFGRGRTAGSGLYLDGGFGVGKTHLLAAGWNAFPGTKAYGSFLEYTALVGALGFAETVHRLAALSLVCIDEFELDDPGDTLIMSRLLAELLAGGTHVIATSNTAPDALGDGRFAAQDFRRELDRLSAAFEVVSLDGEDYREQHTGLFHTARTESELDAQRDRAGAVGARVVSDSFSDVLGVLAAVHPIGFSRLAAAGELMLWRGAAAVASQGEGLRLVAFIDRLYDGDRALALSGIAASELFAAEIVDSGYEKKYRRALSRLGELVDRGIRRYGVSR